MLSNREILKELDKKVYGHERAKKALITAVKRSKTRYYQKWALLDTEPVDRLNCLLIGDSGTGKTHLMQSLSEIMEFPFIYVDATQLTPTGNSDGINQKKLVKTINDKAAALLNTHHNYKSIDGVKDQLFIFVDEIDKLANSFDSSGKWNTHVQSNFLTLIDDKADLSGVTWVFAGTFSGIERETKGTNALGFTSTATEKEVKKITDEDLIENGLIPELVGRIGVITELDKFAESDYIKILNELLLPSKYRHLSKCGVSFENLTADSTAVIAKKGVKQGIRGLKRELDAHYLEDEFNDEEEVSCGY